MPLHRNSGVVVPKGASSNYLFEQLLSILCVSRKNPEHHQISGTDRWVCKIESRVVVESDFVFPG